jgi:hypothetical protein
MPATSVADIEINPASGDMVIATHGRGIYKINLSSLRALANHNRAEEKLFTPTQALLPSFDDIGNKVDYSTITKTPFSFWLKEDKQVTLTIETDSSIVWNKDIFAKAGFNQYRWDLITEHVQNDMPYFIHYEKFIEAGDYRVILSFNDKRYEQSFQVIERNTR